MPGCARCGEENPARARFCLGCGAPLAAAESPATSRKVVTVVFCDLVGSTALAERLDPEALRAVLGRYFADAAAALERHGGTVEKFIGDAVMCVFGIPTVHEDDALRALRAVTDLRRALAELNRQLHREWGVELAVRIGVNTGAVVAGDPRAGQALVTGDPVNTAARLQQAAESGQVLIGQATHRLVADAVHAEPLEPLELRGKRLPVAAWRLLDLAPQTTTVGRGDAPLVGRRAELRTLDEIRAVVMRAHRPELALIAGEPGVGKSRLLAAWLAGLEGAAPVLRGRCLSYGEGITFWPVREMILARAPDGGPDSIAALLPGDPEARRVGLFAAAAIGTTELSLAREEVFWAIRRLVGALAGAAGLVMVIEDLHWAEPTLLELLLDLRERVERPLVIICSARPEFSEAHPGWIARQEARLIRLGPLERAETMALATALAPDDLGEQGLAEVLRAAGGNPLFLEQLLALRADPAADGGVPPNLEALMASRIEHLPAAERRVAERAAVIGQEFWDEAVRVLGDGGSEPVEPILAALERRELIVAGGAPLGGHAARRFRHALIRDAAYDSMPKELRSRLHETLADWLEVMAAPAEISGHHLESAHRLRLELRPPDEVSRALAERAADRIGRAGRRALALGDMPAAAGLLGRAVALASRKRGSLLCELGAALMGLGDFEGADRSYRAAIELADGGREPATVHRARIGLAMLGQFLGLPDDDPDGTVAMARRAADEFAAADEGGLAEAWLLIGHVENVRGRWAASAEAFERALGHARAAGDRRLEADLLAWLGGALASGPETVSAASDRCRALAEEALDDPLMRAHIGCGLAWLAAADGRVEESRRIRAASRKTYLAFGLRPLAGATALWGLREAVAIDPAGEERELAEGLDLLETLGERGFLSTLAPLLGEARLLQGDLVGAGELSERGREATSPQDVLSQVLWRGLRARVLAQEGDHMAASTLARAAIVIASGTDSPTLIAGAELDLAEVLRAAGRDPEAMAVARRARRRWDAKGCSAGRNRADAFLSGRT